MSLVASYQEIHDPRDPAFAEALGIYERAFPPNERQRPELIRELLEKQLYRMVVGRLGEQVVCMALLWAPGDKRFLLLDYLAVHEQYRGLGMGHNLLRALCAMPGIAGKYLLIEAEDPQHGLNREMRTRRVAFYRRNGARQLLGVRYILPPLSGDAPTEMILMILPDFPEGSLPGSLVRELVISIYAGLYGRGPDDLLLRQILESIPCTVQTG
jgi:ribosomal protein S18 acetylase RimI-like enzyme